MKIRIHSDLHHEFYKDLNFSFIENIDVSKFDALILAGDICSYPNLKKVLEGYCQLETNIVFVPGNHEYWFGTKKKIQDTLDNISNEHNNFHWLNNNTVTINNQRFIGATSWYPNSDYASLNRSMWSDFCYIYENPEKWIFDEAENTKQFLTDNLQESDIVVSHMLPSFRSVHAKYANSDFNCFFVNNFEPLILDRQPKMWIHGHTHEACDYYIDKTIVVANPRGYPRRYMEDIKYENVLYQEEMIVEI